MIKTIDNKHYNTLTDYYLKRFGKKAFKISLNTGLTCPNKDGSKGFGGCTYCSKTGSGDFAGKKTDPIEKQFKDVLSVMESKWHDAYYIPYFQANTNTYAPLDVLKGFFEKAITLSDKVKMISISTRPDCLEDDKISYLASLNKRIPLQIELGLQTVNEKTSKLINRCHDLKCFTDCVKKLKENNIEVVVHIMNGLPFETREDMFNTIKYLNTLDIDGIKRHSLCIIKDTKMANDYIKNPFPLLTLEEYVDIVVTQIRMLNPKVIIHRLQADCDKDDLIAPKWVMRKLVVMNEIDKIMRKNNYYQGDLFNN
jgi:radical SAM protein (TIGR01212 family)